MACLIFVICENNFHLSSCTAFHRSYHTPLRFLMVSCLSCSCLLSFLLFHLLRHLHLAHRIACLCCLWSSRAMRLECGKASRRKVNENWRRRESNLILRPKP